MLLAKVDKQWMHLTSYYLCFLLFLCSIDLWGGLKWIGLEWDTMSYAC